jgi:NAD(P)-dependent dehydrogenase (short-subunit alcohol dehydrogenase family)
MPTALITGASRGLGRALATSLARDGWHLIIDARGAEALAATEAELAALGGHVTAITGDVADPQHRFALTRSAAGGLDLLVNNASSLGPSPLPALSEYSITALREVYEVNVLAPLALTQLLLRRLRDHEGSVVNVSSDAAVEAYPGWGGYGSSKAALDRWSAVLAEEEPRLRVYSFDPGDMRTTMHQDAFPGEDISDRPEPESVVPALRRLVAERPASGRYRAETLATSGAVA